MASRRTEKQNMIRAYEKEQEERRKNEQLKRHQEEKAERLAYDIELQRELEEEEEDKKIKEMKRLFIAEAYEMDMGMIW